MTTSPSVIRDGIDPLIVTTKFDIDHEHSSETGAVSFVDITSKIYIQHGDSAISLDFGIFGNVTEDYLQEEFTQEIEALERLVGHINDVREHLTREFEAVKAS